MQEVYGRNDWPGAKAWYVPHQAALNPNNGKIRVGFHCSSKRETSINENLLSGHDLINQLVGILLRLRIGSICGRDSNQVLRSKSSIKVENEGMVEWG